LGLGHVPDWVWGTFPIGLGTGPRLEMGQFPEQFGKRSWFTSLVLADAGELVEFEHWQDAAGTDSGL
jgi:hypothetical protein